jgi:hypothetical protein
MILMLPLLIAAAGGDRAPANRGESDSYVLRKAVISSAGTYGESTSYSSSGTMGQPHPNGILTSASYQLYAGFWNGAGPVPTGAEEIPPAFRLSQNYPNPFNPATKIDYSIADKSVVDLRIFDVSGRLVRTLVSESRLPGAYSVVWDGRNDGGRAVATGIYFYRMVAGRESSVRKMVLIR